MKKKLSVSMLCLLSLLLLGAVGQKTSEIDVLKSRVQTLEVEVEQLKSNAKLWNERISTEYGLPENEQAIYEELIRLKKKVSECCPK